jgi:hypothetical protein
MKSPFDDKLFLLFLFLFSKYNIRTAVLYILIVVQLYPGNYFKQNSAGAMVQEINLSFCPKTDAKGFPIFVERCYFY